MVGRPWESLERLKLRELASESELYGGEKLRTEHLRELSDVIENERDKLRWLLDDDIEMEEGLFGNERRNWAPPKQRRGGDVEAIQFLVDRLSGCAELTVKDWKFSKMMKQSGLQFTEGQLLKIVERLGDKGQWRHASSLVEWVYSSKEHRHYKSRFVYTKLLAVLGKARRPHEALQVFNLMRGDCHIYPDMPAYRSIAVALGQAGLLKELINIIECMKQKPSKGIKNMCRKNWDPILQPDAVVYNAVLNACVPTRQWRGVYWVFEQLRKSGLKPNGATYGLAMEVMLQSGKYDLVHEFFKKMKRSGVALKALTYKVLVKAFWVESKVDEAVQAVREMEQRGVVGIACVYYELACCLCNTGRWQEAMVEIEKLKRLPRTKPLEVTFTGMILSSMDGGHIDDCVSIFEHSKDHCAPDIGIVNAMLKVYAQNDMFSKAKDLFEETKTANPGFNMCRNDNTSSSVSPDAYTYSSMLKASARALQWEYFEYVYKEMALSGYQLNPKKHAVLLVEASRAGKWYLLEHAFDTILEAGDIPPPSFFTEMVCQAIVRHDYERALASVNTIAHAPFQVSEHQWKDLFEENRDRISRTSLKELLDTHCNYDLSKEATVSNFSRVLQSLCAPGSSNVLLESVAFGNVTASELPSDGCNRGFLGDGSIDMHPTSTVGLDLPARTLNYNPREDLQVNKGSVISVSSDNLISNDREEGVDICLKSANYGDRMAKHLADDLEPIGSIDSADCFHDRNSEYIEHGDFDVVNELDLDMSTHEVGDSHVSDLPSAYEILEIWKESRKKDGIYFPFLGWK
ncbi:unnamed protein product [Ilex paraguariensis]|uniref:Pentatricopeptide repeat-containing protein n=1 Tax=Ilex paraguariensis TaxID=185542 RepID=A0ABC8TS46_9AQUA